MNTKVVSSAEPTLHFCRQPTTKKHTSENTCSSISFRSQVSKSRLLSTKNPFGSRRNGGPTRIRAFYAPPAETAQLSLYEVLGITESDITTFSDIKKAYKQMARKYHPDVSPPDRVDEYTKRFIMVHEAYETLSDPKPRASYDRDLFAGFGSSFSAKRRHSYDQRMEEAGDWKVQWQSQVEELNRKNANKNSRGKMSWGERMRSQRL